MVITAENTSGCELVWTQFVYNQSSPAAGIESFGGTEGVHLLNLHLFWWDTKIILSGQPIPGILEMELPRGLGS